MNQNQNCEARRENKNKKDSLVDQMAFMRISEFCGSVDHPQMGTFDEHLSKDKGRLSCQHHKQSFSTHSTNRDKKGLPVFFLKVQ